MALRLRVRIGDAGEQAETLAETLRDHRRTAIADMVGLIGMGALKASGGDEVLEVERALGLEVHRRAERALRHVGGGRFDDEDRRDDLGAHRFQRRVAAVAGPDIVASVDLEPVLRNPAHGEVRSITLAPADLDARHATHRFRHILVGHLADVLCGDDVDDRLRFALDVDRFLKRRADTGDDDILAGWRVHCRTGELLRGGLRSACLILRGGGEVALRDHRAALQHEGVADLDRDEICAGQEHSQRCGNLHRSLDAIDLQAFGKGPGSQDLNTGLMREHRDTGARGLRGNVKAPDLRGGFGGRSHAAYDRGSGHQQMNTRVRHPILPVFIGRPISGTLLITRVRVAGFPSG